jgi:drug/metabolite transporter (DMT)-like permease
MVTDNDIVMNFDKYLKFDSFNFDSFNFDGFDFDGFDHEIIIFLISSIILGVAVSWGGTLMWNKASTLLPISLAGQLIVIETISALSYVYIYDSHLPSFVEILGITMIIGGVILGIRNVQFTSNDPELITKPSQAQIE